MHEQEHAAPDGLQPPDEFEKTGDRTLYWTLSLYVTADAVRTALGAPEAPGHDVFAQTQTRFHDSIKLRDAMDPLFNDIADREQQGSVGDFLFDVNGPRQGEDIHFLTPPQFEWETEGTRYLAVPPNLDDDRSARVRRFWYAHMNGAMSYHISFRINYQHTIADYYFISLLQKAVAPKEFKPKSAPAAPFNETTPDLNIFPLEQIRIRPQGADTEMRFWEYIAHCFQSDAVDLFSQLAATMKTPAPDRAALSFSSLNMRTPFIEVPGLMLPAARSLFFFLDKTFFEMQVPPLAPGGVERQSRVVLVPESQYAKYPEDIQKRTADAESRNEDIVRLDADYWRQVDTPVTHRELQYLFLAGFNQNIIDFMNQDASEILDSLDPIYPSKPEHYDEKFFIRLANPRALTTYVRSSRSLETGNDYIGACPYAFLIHVTSLHNEMLSRAYETTTIKLVEDVKACNRDAEFGAASEKFYQFRMQTHADYSRHRYPNIFRYDTESEVFGTLEKMRGIARKNAYLDALVVNAENQTKDAEARLLRREADVSKEQDTAMNLLLGAVGVFGFFQLVFQWAEMFETYRVSLTPHWPFLIRDPEAVQSNVAIHISTVGLVLSLLFTAGLLLAAIIFAARFLRKRRAR